MEQNGKLCRNFQQYYAEESYDYAEKTPDYAEISKNTVEPQFNEVAGDRPNLNRCCVALGITGKLKVLFIKCLSSLSPFYIRKISTL